MPICKGDMMYCVDNILGRPNKDFFARKGIPIQEEFHDVTVAVDRPGYEPVSSTLWRQREDYCAKLIQNIGRKHKIRQQGGGSSSHAATGQSGKDRRHK